MTNILDPDIKLSSQLDGKPTVLYAKKGIAAGDEIATPLVASSANTLLISDGIALPEYDYVDWSDLTAIVLKIGGATGPSVATLSIVGSTLTKV